MSLFPCHGTFLPCFFFRSENSNFHPALQGRKRARNKINNYFNKIHKKRISQRSKIFYLHIIFTKMIANFLCIKSIVILLLALFCMLPIETND